MRKLKFLWGVLRKANFLYNEAIKVDAQRISGGLQMDAVKESYGTSYDEPSTCTLTMGRYLPIYHELRPWEESKTTEIP